MTKTSELIHYKTIKLSDCSGRSIQWVVGNPCDYLVLHGEKDIHGKEFSEYYTGLSRIHSGINMVDLSQERRSEEKRKDPKYKRFGKRRWIPEKVIFLSHYVNYRNEYRQLEIDTIEDEIPLNTLDYVLRHDKWLKFLKRELTGR